MSRLLTSGWAFALGVMFSLVAIVVIPIEVTYSPANLIAEILAMTLMVLLMGQRIVGRPLGALVSSRNVMSLTRFQALLWTILILATFTTIIVGRVWRGESIADFFNNTTPPLRPDLLALMGISYASAVGSGLVLSNKTTKEPTADAKLQMKASVGDTASNANPVAGEPVGVLYTNKSPKDAAFTDIFEGDEVSDTNLLDMSKVQMFFFTIVSAVIFLGMVFGDLSNEKVGLAKTMIPRLPDSLIALMGISHTAYLGGKTVTSTPVTSTPQQKPPGS